MDFGAQDGSKIDENGGSKTRRNNGLKKVMPELPAVIARDPAGPYRVHFSTRFKTETSP